MKIFDMTQPLYHACRGWPTYEMTRFTYEKVLGVDGFTAERINMNSHTGTHLDAPYHFFADGKTISDMPLDCFMGRAIIADIRGIGAAQGIDAAHLRAHVEGMEPGCIVLLYTGWDKKRGFSKEYYNDWPYLSAEGARFLLDKGVKGVGIDGMSVGGWYEGTGRPCHEILLGNGIWLLEELTFPEELLKYKSCHLTAVPLKLEGFGGSPTRAYATVED